MAPAKIPVPASTETKKASRVPPRKEISAPLDKRIASESKLLGRRLRRVSNTRCLRRICCAPRILPRKYPARRISDNCAGAGAWIGRSDSYYSWPQLQPLPSNIPTIQKYLGSQRCPLPRSRHVPQRRYDRRPARNRRPEGPQTSSGSPAQSGQAASNQAATNQAAANVEVLG